MANLSLLLGTSTCAVPVMGECCWVPACNWGFSSLYVLLEFGHVCVHPCLPPVGVCTS